MATAKTRTRPSRVSIMGPKTRELAKLVEKAKTAKPGEAPALTYRVRDWREATHYLQRLRSFGDQLLPKGTRFERLGRKIIFPNGGSLEFVR